MSETNGKKRGRFNIIDLIVIALIIGAVGLFAVKFIGDGAGASGQTVRITFYEEECPDFVPPNTKPGDPVYDSTDANHLGTVVDIQTGESVSYSELPSEDAEFVAASREGYCSVFLTSELQNATVTAHGVQIGSTIYAPGHSVVIYAGQGKYFLQVYSVEVIG